MAKVKTDEEGKGPFEYTGVREADYSWLGWFGQGTVEKIQKLLECMEWTKLVIFEYGGDSRVVAPFVVGISSEGNPLMRGFQLQGRSFSGKGPGWRVYQIMKMENLGDFFEFFNPDEFDFDQNYPWIYRVIGTL